MTGHEQGLGMVYSGVLRCTLWPGALRKSGAPSGGRWLSRILFARMRKKCRAHEVWSLSLGPESSRPPRSVAGRGAANGIMPQSRVLPCALRPAWPLPAPAPAPAADADPHSVGHTRRTPIQLSQGGGTAVETNAESPRPPSALDRGL